MKIAAAVLSSWVHSFPEMKYDKDEICPKKKNQYNFEFCDNQALPSASTSRHYIITLLTIHDHPYHFLKTSTIFIRKEGEK